MITERIDLNELDRTGAGITYLCYEGGNRSFITNESVPGSTVETYTVNIPITSMFWKMFNLPVQENALNPDMNDPAKVYSLFFEHFFQPNNDYPHWRFGSSNNEFTRHLMTFWRKDIERYYTPKGYINHINNIISPLERMDFQANYSLGSAMANTSFETFEKAQNIYTLLTEF